MTPPPVQHEFKKNVWLFLYSNRCHDHWRQGTRAKPTEPEQIKVAIVFLSVRNKEMGIKLAVKHFNAPPNFVGEKETRSQCRSIGSQYMSGKENEANLCEIIKKQSG